MAEQDADRNKKVQGFLDFFPVRPTKEKKSEIPTDKTVSLTNKEIFIPLIVHATANEHTVKVHFPGETTHFYSLLSADKEGSLAHVQNGESLLIAPLDPPIGNIKIRRASMVHLNFFTDLYIVDAKVRFEKITEQGTIQLSFPDQVERGPQKRNYPRIKVGVQTEVTLFVQRPAGITFQARLNDISEGGICFYTDSPTARIASESTVNLIIGWPEGVDIYLQANILGVTKKEDLVTYRAKFYETKIDTARILKSMIDYLTYEQQIIRKRKFK